MSARQPAAAAPPPRPLPRAASWPSPAARAAWARPSSSANLAAALARRAERVLVLDADLGLANLDVVLNLFPKITLHDVFTGKATLDEAILPAPGGFSVLLAGSGMVEYSRLTPEVRDQLQQVIDEVRAALRPRAARHRRRHLRRGAVHRVAGRRGAGGGHARAHLADRRLRHHQGAGHHAGPAQVQLLVNQTRKPGEGRAVRQQLQQVVDRYVNAGRSTPVRLDLLGEVPPDPAVREAVQRRQLLLEALPGTPAALAVGRWPRGCSTEPATALGAAGTLARRLAALQQHDQRPGAALRPGGLGEGDHLGALRQPALHLGLEHRLAPGRAVALAVHHAHAAQAARAASRRKAASASRASSRRRPCRSIWPWIAQWPRRSRAPRRGRRRGGGSSGRRR